VEYGGREKQGTVASLRKASKADREMCSWYVHEIASGPSTLGGRREILALTGGAAVDTAPVRPVNLLIT
jgi:hypothetical protein